MSIKSLFMLRQCITENSLHLKAKNLPLKAMSQEQLYLTLSQLCDKPVLFVTLYCTFLFEVITTSEVF